MLEAGGADTYTQRAIPGSEASKDYYSYRFGPLPCFKFIPRLSTIPWIRNLYPSPQAANDLIITKIPP
jgi:hypothetical protein